MISGPLQHLKTAARGRPLAPATRREIYSAPRERPQPPDPGAGDGGSTWGRPSPFGRRPHSNPRGFPSVRNECQAESRSHPRRRCVADLLGFGPAAAAECSCHVRPLGAGCDFRQSDARKGTLLVSQPVCDDAVREWEVERLSRYLSEDRISDARLLLCRSKGQAASRATVSTTRSQSRLPTPQPWLDVSRRRISARRRRPA